MRGADLLIQTLKNEGIDTIFSLSGNQIMPVYDACLSAGINIIHTRHEGAAVYMAEAWSQLTGRVGVALLTGAPGFANGLSPLFSAQQSETPLLLLSGDSPRAQDGMGAFQELDQTRITDALVKKAVRTAKAEDFGADALGLMHLAQQGRPGPVHLALPFDLLEAEISSLTPLPEAGSPLRFTDNDETTDTEFEEELDKVAAQIDQAQRPLLLTGPHCSPYRVAGWRAHAALQNVPVVCMESPRGLKDPSLGALGQHIASADLIVLIGKKLDFTLEFGKVFSNASVIVIDPSRAALKQAEEQLGSQLLYAIQAPATTSLDWLDQHCLSKPESRPDSAWHQKIQNILAHRTLAQAGTDNNHSLLPQALCARVQAVLDQADEAVLVCDGGEFGQWAQGFCKTGIRVINGVSGAIGGGIAYAMAAKAVHPQATVIALMGDGTAGFHLAEFDTAVRNVLPFIAVIGNDEKWNAEHLIQIRDYGPDRTYGCTLGSNAHYGDVAQALGGLGFSCQNTHELDAALKQAVASKHKPSCIDVRLNGQAAPVYTAFNA